MLGARVDATQASIVAGLRAVGCSVETLHRVGRGCPDLLVGVPGHGNVLLEIKLSGEGLNDRQAEWHAGWRGQVRVVRSLEEALSVVRGQGA